MLSSYLQLVSRHAEQADVTPTGKAKQVMLTYTVHCYSYGLCLPIACISAAPDDLIIYSFKR